MYDSLVKRLKIFNMDQKVDCMYVELVMQYSWTLFNGHIAYLEHSLKLFTGQYITSTNTVITVYPYLWSGFLQKLSNFGT